MPIGGWGCRWKQRSKEERTRECPWADRAVAGSNVQKRGGHVNVHWQIVLSLGATFKERGHVNVHGRKEVPLKGNIQRKDMNAHWRMGLSLEATFKRGEDT